jgi:glucose-1-phosphate cytidylyltransferase
VFDYLDDDNTILERTPLQRLAEEGQLMSYSHNGFWQCMDSKREKDILEKLWASGNAPWKVWAD